jgi:hypothetical protein
MKTGFGFVQDDDADRVDAVLDAPRETPKGAHVRRGRRRRQWEVVDATGLVLGTWATWPAALRDAERYQKAEAAGRK